MTITLTLSGNSSILTAEYFPPIELKDDKYVCGLIDFQTYNSIPNIDEDNNLFIIDDRTYNIPTGSYEIDDIQTYLHKVLKIPKADKESLIIRANNNTLKCEIFSKKEIDFEYPGEQTTIGRLLGFSKKKLVKDQWHYSDLPVDINKVNIIRVECNIISGTYINNQEVHILHEFSISVSPGYKIIEVPRNVIYLPVTVNRISSIIVKLIDQDGNLINFRGETITIRLHLKPQNDNT